jgi:hypothetical protein
MYSFAQNIDEGKYYFPLFKGFTKRKTFSDSFFCPWLGFEGVRRKVSAAYGQGLTVAASDFSATDEHFQLPATMEAADLLAQLFEQQYRSDFLDSISRMLEVPLLISPTQQITGPHGVSSGSMWTNFIETVFDWIFAKYCELTSEGHVRGLYAIGDDMAWTTDWSEDQFTHWLEDKGVEVGQVIKAEKTMLHPDNVKTLQRLFIRGYKQSDSNLLRGVYPTVRALLSIVYPERWHGPNKWDYDKFAIRTFSILENCVDHPLFPAFVVFICMGNPRLVLWARRSTPEQLDQLAFKARKDLPGLVPTYNQEKKDARLSSFASVRIARQIEQLPSDLSHLIRQLRYLKND